jgi:TilS substrate binding domain
MADEATATNAASNTTTPDPEVTAIGKVNEALAQLDPAIQQRVLRWAADRFNLTLPQTKRPAADGNKGGKQPEDDDENEPEVPDTFADFASLYDAASPTTEADKALVAGYWLQVIQENADWKGFSPNKELKNLGHGIENITVALGALIDSTPRLVMQTHKAGKTKQARKKYKMTNEGIKRVKQMLAGNGGQE